MLLVQRLAFVEARWGNQVRNVFTGDELQPVIPLLELLWDSNA